MQQIDLNQPIPITLPLGAWNTVQQILSKRPWDEVNALIQTVQQQIDAKLQQSGETVTTGLQSATRSPFNGEARE